PEPVVEPKPGPQYPGRTLLGMRGDGKAHRTHQMRGYAQPDVAFGERGMHAAKIPPLEYREIAMDQPGRRRGCAAAEIALFEQKDTKSPAGGVARHAD